MLQVILCCLFLVTCATNEAKNVDLSWGFGLLGPDRRPVNLKAGDTITFRYKTPGRQHNVAQFPSPSDFDECLFSNGADLIHEGSAGDSFVLTFDSVGTYYFGCATDTHCLQGAQKVQVVVRKRMKKRTMKRMMRSMVP